MKDDNPLTTPHAAEPLDLTNAPADGAPESLAGRPRSGSLRRVLEPLAMGIMALGALMMFQPFTKALYTYSFIVILIGTLMFIVVTKFPE
jgi:hypothetical protein